MRKAMNSQAFSRRQVLKGMSAGALGLGLGMSLSLNQQAAQAQGEMAVDPAKLAVFTFAVGDFEITVIRDAVLEIPAANFAVNAEESTVMELLEANGYPSDRTLGIVQNMVVNTGDGIVLFDTGFGTTNPVGGNLIPTMELLGMSPDDVDTVILSHFHPDHINGVAADGAPLYPNAMYLLSQPEWDVIQSAPTGNADFDGFLEGVSATLQPLVDADQLGFYSAEEEIVGGIQAVAAHGHTPGHMGHLIASGGQQLLNIVDAIPHPVITFERPDWHFSFDADPDMAVETRRALLNRAADEDLLIAGYHLPFPGIGHVANAGDDAFRFVPLGY